MSLSYSVNLDLLPGMIIATQMPVTDKKEALFVIG
jgi:hypothetical protein